jgi:2-C-methyl-D-erythritol 4-phosphate cytidylyltransferase/2-C-methyl-D-erythritol 2,4-cyclodiphosphate synthase
MSRVAAVVVAAGRATRFPGPIPKQFLPLGGASVLERSIALLTACRELDGGIVVVVASEEIGGARAHVIEGLAGVRRIVAGGVTRVRSVLAGVEAAEAELVLVHDAARPFARPSLVAAVIDATRLHGAAVPALEVADTVKRIDGRGFVEGTLDRRILRLAQTPQGARREVLLTALRRAVERGIEPTDEAEALEREGIPIALVPGDPDNVKITTPDDWAAAERRVAALRPGAPRIGHGFDIHRFGEGRPLRLGGVEFPGERGLIGHSDADVVLHAAMDALLGAAGLADIGHHFPPEDPRFAGADSRALAGEVARLLREGSWEIGNLDLTLLAETPRIGARRTAMLEATAAAFGVDPSRVGLKATTLEQLGSLGRSEGIACHAVALLHRAGGGP